MKTIKSWLIALLSVLMMACCAMGLITVGVKADADSTLARLQAINLTLDDTQVRMPLEDDGEGGLKPTDDIKKNGIKFVIKMDKAKYEAISEKTIFGALVLPKDYIDDDEFAVTEANVFGDNPNYVFSKEEAVDGKKQIIRVETYDLVLSDNNTKEDTSDDFYYYNVSMIDLNEGNIDREFMAIPYVKARINGENNAEFVYDIKEEYAKTESMAYLAQKKVEDSSISSIIRDALQTNYINGLKASFAVNLKRSYGDFVKESVENIKLDLGANLTLDSIKQALLEKGFDASNYTENESSLKVNSVAVESAKVYANGKTNAEIKIDWSANEVEDSQTIASVAKYYKSASFNSIVLTDDLAITVNPDYAFEGGKVNGTYKLFTDGKILALVGGNNYFGTYEDGLVFDDGENTYEFALASSYELPLASYSRIAGVYKVAGTKKMIQLNSDGTILENLTTNGSYVLVYDETTNAVKITITSFAGSNIEGDLEYAEETGFSFGTYAAEERKVASADAYKAFAGTFNGEMDFVGSDPENKDTSATTWQDYIKFNADGTLEFRGAEQLAHSSYSFSQTLSGVKYYPGTAVLMDVKYGHYVLYTNGSIELHIPQFANSKANIYSQVDDAIIPAVYDATAGTITVDFSKYSVSVTRNNDKTGSVAKTWDPNASVVFTKVESSNVDLENEFVPTEEFMANLYTEFTCGFEGTEKLSGEKSRYRKYSELDYGWLAVQAQHDFYTNGAYRMSSSSFTQYGSYELIPITETFGEVKVTILAELGANSTINYLQNPYTTQYNKIYYTKVDTDLFRLRIDHEAGNKLHTQNGGTGYGQFVDAVVILGPGSKPLDTEYTSRIYYDMLTGGVGTTEEPVVKTYKSHLGSLKLINDGVMQLQPLKPQAGKSAYYLGGRGIFNNGGEDLDATWSLVPYNPTSGKFYIDMSDTPAKKTDENADRFAEGEYKVENGETIITFTYKGVLYQFTDASILVRTLPGTYVGNGSIIELFDNNNASLGGVDATYTASNGIITITTADSELTGNYVISSDMVKLDFGSTVYLKQELTLTELYAKYAGTYNAEYNVNYHGVDITATMQLVLNADGTLSATGSGEFTELKTNAVVDFCLKSGNTLTALDFGHLGSTANTGRYTFELVGDKVQIVLLFDIMTVNDTKITVTAGNIFNNVGYSSFINYHNSEGLKADSNYVGTTSGTEKFGRTYYSVFSAAGNWFVNAYCVGSVGEDTLDIEFQAYNQVIHFEKAVETPAE